MPTKLSVYKMGRSTLTGIKSIRRKKQKQKIIEASHKIGITNHGSDRLYERIEKDDFTVRKNIIASIYANKILHNSKHKCYKVYGDYGTYVLGEDMKIVTVRIDNRESVLDRYYKPLTVGERRAILLGLGLKL